MTRRVTPHLRELLAETVTPLAVYQRLLALSPTRFLFESVTGGEQVARYYAGLAPPSKRDLPLNPESVERGRLLATSGDPAARIPACMDCHNASSLEVYPRLAGQHAVYMANRLRLWKGGLAPHTETETIMAPIARLLSEQQIDDVSAYFSVLQARRAP